MPDFRLSTEEAEQLTAYLLNGLPGNELRRLPTGDAANGLQLVATLGCLSCHPSQRENRFETKSLADLEGLDWDLWGCVASGDGRGDAPAFEFGAAERAALLAFGSTDLSSLRRTAPAEFSGRQFRELRCAACHERDGSAANCQSASEPQAAATPVASPEFRRELLAMPTPPPLTYVGEQLRSPWLEDLLAGRVDYRVRPWLDVRMPSFPQRAPWLAVGPDPRCRSTC